MDAADFVGAVEVGERAGHPQHAMIAARRQPHGVGGFTILLIAYVVLLLGTLLRGI